MPLSPGQIIEGKYRVVGLIGQGGMGTVYEGEHVRIERRVAIKVLHAEVASDPLFAKRFEREARAVSQINSDYVCDVLDFGDLDNGERFMVMEFLEGESFEDRLDKGRLSPTELAPIAFELLEGLGVMHNNGVVHRDLKPANVFLSRNRNRRGETVKILDFGVAKVIPKTDEGAGMTSTGIMMGTPLYMSPEQARGARDVDGRTDLYAASVMFYRALSGRLPHAAENLHELLFKIVLEDAKPLHEVAPGIDDVFAGIVMRGLAREADQRYSSAREYQEAIAAWGKAHGRTSLHFTISLPSTRPPLLSIGPNTPQRVSIDVPPQTPVPAGTPVAWSEKPSASAMKTMPAAQPPSVTPASEPMPMAMPAPMAISAPMAPRPMPSERPSAGKTFAIVGAISIGALALGAFVAVKVLSTPKTAKTPPVASSAAAANAPPPPATETAPPAPPSPNATEGSPPPPQPEPPVATAAPKPTAVARPVSTAKPVTPEATSSVATVSTAPTPSATPATSASSGKARKFRTNLD